MAGGRGDCLSVFGIAARGAMNGRGKVRTSRLAVLGFLTRCLSATCACIWSRCLWLGGRTPQAVSCAVTQYGCYLGGDSLSEGNTLVQLPRRAAMNRSTTQATVRNKACMPLRGNVACADVRDAYCGDDSQHGYGPALKYHDSHGQMSNLEVQSSRSCAHVKTLGCGGREHTGIHPSTVLAVVITVRGAQHEGARDPCPLYGHLPGHLSQSTRATPHSPCCCHHMVSVVRASPNN